MAVEFNYNRVVATHEDMRTKLEDRLEKSNVLGREATAANRAADGLDEGRAGVVKTARELEEAMAAARLDASSAQGAAEAADAFSATDAGTVEEECSALAATASQVASVTEAALAGVSGSLEHITSTYGEMAAGVQETGVRGEALEAR